MIALSVSIHNSTARGILDTIAKFEENLMSGSEAFLHQHIDFFNYFM
jgi:hypothetical protein